MLLTTDSNTWCKGYCFDANTGCETNERTNIDQHKWELIASSKVMKAVYSGAAITQFWHNLFVSHQDDVNNGNNICEIAPLAKQTFIRLMGNDGTPEHADYYYFKRNTDIFSGSDGQTAVKAAKNYRICNNLPCIDIEQHDATVMKNLVRIETDNKTNHMGAKALNCHICGNTYLQSTLQQKRLNRLKRGGFGVDGYDVDKNDKIQSTWHCPSCMIQPFGIYTTWISLSELNLLKNKDSILAICPTSHLLNEWDIPQSGDSQLCNDFNWKMKWHIPTNVGFGDVIIFNIKTIHASSPNKTLPKRYRISCDTRICLKDKEQTM